VPRLTPASRQFKPKDEFSARTSDAALVRVADVLERMVRDSDDLERLSTIVDGLHRSRGRVRIVVRDVLDDIFAPPQRLFGPD
jgi:hypothetical protein